MSVLSKLSKSKRIVQGQTVHLLWTKYFVKGKCCGGEEYKAINQAWEVQDAICPEGYQFLQLDSV